MRVQPKAAIGVGGLVLAGGALVFRPGTWANKAACHQVDRASRELRYLGGRLKGVKYRLAGRHPDLQVVDTVLADRIRSEIGGLEKRLDLPHVQVWVDDHIARLHGEVGRRAEARRVERAVRRVPGVVGVESYLHVGFDRGQTRPSGGRAVRAPSEALRRLTDAAIGAGVPPDEARTVVRAVLASFSDRLPARELHKMGAHLPADVRALLEPPRRSRRQARVRHVHELVAQVSGATTGLPTRNAEDVTVAVVGVLRDLVPADAKKVGLVLPAELRALWLGEVP